MKVHIVTERNGAHKWHDAVDVACWIANISWWGLTLTAFIYWVWTS